MIVKAKIAKGDADLNAAHQKLGNLPSVQAGSNGRTIANLVAYNPRDYKINPEGGLYLSDNRFKSDEGIRQADVFAEAATKKNGAVVAEGYRAKGVMQRLAYYASANGTSPRGVQLAKALAGLQPKAAYILSRTGFLERLKSLGSNSTKQFMDTGTLLQGIATSPSGQWQDILDEVDNARRTYTSKFLQQYGL